MCDQSQSFREMRLALSRNDIDNFAKTYEKNAISDNEKRQLFMAALWMQNFDFVKWIDQNMIAFNIDDYDSFEETILMLADGWHNIIKYLSDRIPANHRIRQSPILNILSNEWITYMENNR